MTPSWQPFAGSSRVAGRRPRVALLHGSNDLYGASRVLLDDVRVFGSLGWQVSVLLPEDGPLTAPLRDAGADVELGGLHVLRRVSPASARVPLALPAAVARADLVVLWTLALACYLPALALRRRPAVCSVHEIQPGRAGRLLARAAGWLSDGLMANSHATASWLRESGVVRRESVVAYPIAPPREPLPMPSSAHPLHVLMAGRVNGHKGHLEAVHACRLARNAGLDVRLTLLGAPYPGQEEHLRVLLEEIAGEDWVGYGGQVASIRPFLARAHALLVPTTRPEPFGIVALEAWAAGRPVLASDVGGLSEAARLVGGHTFPPGDVHAMSRALLELADRVAAGSSDQVASSAPADVCSLAGRRAAWRELLARVLAEGLEGSAARAGAPAEEAVTWPG